MVCGYHGNAQSLSYNYMGKNGSRTFTPRYTPTPFASLFPPTLIVRPLFLATLFSTLAFSFHPCTFFFSRLPSTTLSFLHCSFLHLGILRSSFSPHPSSSPPPHLLVSSSRATYLLLPASGILCLHLDGVTV